MNKLKQLTTKERDALRAKMRSEQGAATELALEIGISRNRLYEAVAGDAMGYMVLDKIRKYMNPQPQKVA